MSLQKDDRLNPALSVAFSVNFRNSFLDKDLGKYLESPETRL